MLTYAVIPELGVRPRSKRKGGRKKKKQAVMRAHSSLLKGLKNLLRYKMQINIHRID